MFLVRRAIWLLRLYTTVMLVAVGIVAVDVNMQAGAAGRDLASYDRQAYIATLQQRLRGLAAGPQAALPRERAGQAQVVTPLDVTFMAYRGLAQARLALLGLDGHGQDIALLPEPTAATPLPMATDDAEEAAKPCVRRNNVLSC